MNPKEKKVEYIELIYDLIFVYIIGRNNQLLHSFENGFITLPAFMVYVMTTLALIQIWNYTTYYINIYGIYGRHSVRDPSAGKLAYRSPVEAESFDGIPMTYIETAEYDSLRDGALIYAEKLRESGISVELHNTKGTVHGYDMVLGSGMVKDLVRKRIQFLKRTFLNRQ